MSLGGRPKEQGGHDTCNFSLDAESCKVLKKIEDRGENRSKFVESVIRPHINQLDPGESCETLDVLDNTLKAEIISAVLHGNFEKASTLATIGNSLEPFRCLCRLPTNAVVNDGK